MNTIERLASNVDQPSIFAQLTITSIILLTIAAVWGQFDPRTLDGVPVWTKPAKFSLSFVIHFATLAAIVAALTEQNRKCRSISIAGGVMATAFFAEMIYIFCQAAQAEHSHFNYSTPFHERMYALMGVGAVLLIAIPVVIAQIVRHDPTIRPAVKTGIWWGAITSFILTLLTAGYLSSQGGHFIGTPTDPSRVLPFIGWSTEVGDLRPAHFLSLHALQVFSLIGLWIDRRGGNPTLIRPIAVAYALLSLAVLGQAMLGLPLISI